MLFLNNKNNNLAFLEKNNCVQCLRVLALLNANQSLRLIGDSELVDADGADGDVTRTGQFSSFVQSFIIQDYFFLFKN